MNEYSGSTSPGPVFPRVGERWFECYICGFDFPLSQARRHYKSDRLVDAACDDQKTHRDYMNELVIPSDAEAQRRESPEQSVSCQGEADGSRWNEARWYEGKWYDPGDQDCSGETLTQKGK